MGMTTKEVLDKINSSQVKKVSNELIMLVID